MPRFSTIPRKKPPNTAPGILPMPPMIAAMTLFKMEFIPMFGLISLEKAVHYRKDAKFAKNSDG